MRPTAPRAKVIVIAAVFVAALAIWPTVALGEITNTSATIDDPPVNSTSSPPGGVLVARVTATHSGSDQWSATRVTIGPDSVCVNHDNVEDDRDTSRFNVTAPATPSTYDVVFTPYANGSCSTGPGATATLTDGLRVTAPGPNRDLPPRCGIDVILVLDESGSIGANAENVRRASRAFLNALSGTGSKVSIVDFSTRADRPVGYTVVTGQVNENGTGATGTIGTIFEPYLKTGYVPNGWTNWEDAFREVKVANDGATRADLVVFMTDGDPTAHNTGSGDVVTGLVEGEVEALRRAASEADLVKGQKSHVLAMGVGAAVTDGNSARRLTAVSEFDKWEAPG